MTRRNNLLLGISWSLYAASWFLKVIPDEAGNRIPGWDAFLFAVLPDGVGLVLSILFVSSALTNIIPVASLLTLSSRFRRLSSTFSWLFLSAGVLNAHWFVTLGKNFTGLREGYYVWWASFFLLGIASRYRRSQLPAHNRSKDWVLAARTIQ